MNYILIYQEETDGDVIVRSVSREDIKDLTDELHSSDYAIIEGGKIIKNFFENKTSFSAIVYELLLEENGKVCTVYMTGHEFLSYKQDHKDVKVLRKVKAPKNFQL